MTQRINWLKAIFYFSLINTLASFTMMSYGYFNTELITVLLSLPIFTIFYPITLIGTLIYGFKKVLKSKSFFDLMQMADIDSGIGGIMSGIGNKEKEEEDEK